MLVFYLLLTQYAQWTQRGYYPDDPHKENQDEYQVQHPFTNSDRDAMLAVYDGHGSHGHSCARYAKKHLGKCIEKQVRLSRVKKYKEELLAQGITKGKFFDPNQWPLLNAQEYQACCQKAFVECNQQMHASPDVRIVVYLLHTLHTVVVCQVSRFFPTGTHLSGGR